MSGYQEKKLLELTSLMPGENDGGGVSSELSHLKFFDCYH